MKKKILCSLIALVTVVALVACGQKPSGGGSGSENPSGGESTGREATNSVVVGITQDIDSLDPHKATAAGTKEVLFNIFEGLVKPDENGNLIGETYDFPAGTEYHFRRTDGMTYVDMMTSEGNSCRLYTTSEGATVNGMDAWESFEMLYYAG